MLMLTFFGLCTLSVSQLGVPGMEYVEYLRTEPRKSSVEREDSVSKINVPKYRKYDDTGTDVYQRRQDVNVDEIGSREIAPKYRKHDDTGTDLYQRRRDVSVDEIASREIVPKYRKHDNTGTDLYQRRRDVNVDEMASREIKKNKDENNQYTTIQKDIFSEYDYDTNKHNLIETVTADSTASITEIYGEIDKVIPQSDIFKAVPKNYNNKNNEVSENKNNVGQCRGSECDLHASQTSHKQSSVYQNYEDNVSNQDFDVERTEGTKQYVKMVRISPTTRNPIEDTLVYQHQPAYTEPNPSYSTYPVGHRLGPYYASNEGGRYPTGDVYTDRNYGHNQYQTEIYPQNTYPTDVYSQSAYQNERYGNIDYPTYTNPTYDNRYEPSPSYPSHYNAGPRPYAQLYYKTKTYPSAGFRPSEQFFPSTTVQPMVHNYEDNFNAAPLPVRQNFNPNSASSTLRYSKVRPQSQVVEDYNTYKKPTYRAPRYIRPSSVKNYDFDKVPKHVNVEKQVVTTPKPLDPAIEKVLKERAAKAAANRYYTGLQMEIEKSDFMSDAVRAVRSRTHMKISNITKSSGKVKRSTTANPVLLPLTKTSIILPETQYHEIEREVHGNRREGKSIKEFNNNVRPKKEIRIKNFQYNLPSHPLYRNLPGKANYNSQKTTTQSPDIRQKALELKKFQKVKSQFDALVPKATYTPDPYPEHPSYPGQQIHVPRPTTFRPYVVPKYNKFYKPGQYIRPAKVQISRVYEQREYVPKYVRPENVIKQAPPSSFIDIPKESVEVNPTSSYLKAYKEEKPIVYHKPQVSPNYVIVRAPKQLPSSPQYTSGPKVHSNLYATKREHRQIANTPVKPHRQNPAIQNPQREYRAIVQTHDDKSHYIQKPYSNPREHRALINPTSEKPKIRQSYSPKPYTTEDIDYRRGKRRSMEISIDRN
ncbi:unnamed protein product, partial [Meganyctiphanes norvegica]